MKFKFFHNSWFWEILENERIITLSAITLYNNVASWELVNFSVKKGLTVFHSQGSKKLEFQLVLSRSHINACPGPFLAHVS